ncbi:MAG: hypothetical protein ACRC6X_02510 [Culicoidibacterales bacterium]
MAIRKVMSGSKSDSKGRNTQVESYFFDIEKCKTCPFKDGCYKDGELKTRYGYSTAQGCGLLGMTIQATSTIFLANMKRIIKLKEQKSESI